MTVLKIRQRQALVTCCVCVSQSRIFLGGFVPAHEPSCISQCLCMLGRECYMILKISILHYSVGLTACLSKKRTYPGLVSIYYLHRRPSL